MNNTKRMILDIPPDIQMAIRLRAIKDQCTTSDVITRAINIAYRNDVTQAEQELHKNQPRDQS